MRRGLVVDGSALPSLELWWRRRPSRTGSFRAGDMDLLFWFFRQRTGPFRQRLVPTLGAPILIRPRMCRAKEPD
jgi:hypothetical protein